MTIKRNLPMAEQVTQFLHQKIIAGVYPPGEKLPSEEDLSTELGVSRGTIRSALASLAASGLVTRKQGDGTYAKELTHSQNSLMHAIWDYSRLIEASGSVATIECLSLRKRQATAEEARALEIDSQEVVEVVRLFYADEQPIIFSINISPIQIFIAKTQDLNGSLGIQEFIKQYTNREIDRVDVSIFPILPSKQVLEKLTLEEGQPILLIEEIFRDFNRTPVIFASNYHAEDKLNLNNVRPWYSLG
jgi:DNA-binding GntR family transcriptional regulator